ncbi:MAG TPA: hypothetical protein VKD90_21595 [Gemmataceae bacterium]|nr:hypothetical protein [Gemmataceae bacterium]
MATEKSLSGGNLGKVLETYGGKSLKRIITVGATVFGFGLTAAILIRLFRPDCPILATVVFGAGLVIALAYVSTNWSAALAKVEVCECGVRLLRGDGTTELPWERMFKVQVGEFRKAKGRPEHAVIWTTDGKDIELPYGFWAAVGTSRLASTVRRFVEHVEEEVEFTTFGEGGGRCLANGRAQARSSVSGSVPCGPRASSGSWSA